MPKQPKKPSKKQSQKQAARVRLNATMGDGWTAKFLRFAKATRVAQKTTPKKSGRGK